MTELIIDGTGILKQLIRLIRNGTDAYEVESMLLDAHEKFHVVDVFSEKFGDEGIITKNFLESPI